MSTKHIRSFKLAALAITAFAATMTVKVPDAHAVVYCAAGLVRAGCVVRPVVAPTVRGVARRTTRRVVRRSDMMLKPDIFLLGRPATGLGSHRFRYNGGPR